MNRSHRLIFREKEKDMTREQYKFLVYIKNKRTLKQLLEKYSINTKQFYEIVDQPQIKFLYEFDRDDVYENSIIYPNSEGVEAIEKYAKDRQKRILEWISPIVATIALLKSFWPEIMKLFS